MRTAEAMGGKEVLRLRPITEPDFGVLFEQQRDPEYTFMAAFTPRNPTDRDAFERHLRKVLANDDNVMRAIVVDGAVVGSAGSYLMFGERQVCYGIGREFWGRGYATKALVTLLSEVRQRPVFARTAADNYGSIRVLEKAGFVPIGTERAFAEGRGEEVDEMVLRLDAEAPIPSPSES